MAGQPYTKEQGYVKSIEPEPKTVETQANFGTMGGTSEEERPYAAKQCYLKALELDPQDAMAWSSLGIMGGASVGERVAATPVGVQGPHESADALPLPHEGDGRYRQPARSEGEGQPAGWRAEYPEEHHPRPEPHHGQGGFEGPQEQARHEDAPRRPPGHLCDPAQHGDGPVVQDPGSQVTGAFNYRNALASRLTPTSEPSHGLPAGSESFYAPSTGAWSAGSPASRPLAPGQLASQPLTSQLLPFQLLATTPAPGLSSLEPDTVDQSGPVLVSFGAQLLNSAGCRLEGTRVGRIVLPL